MNGHPTKQDEDHAPIGELDRVRLTRAIVSDEGNTLEAGLNGTVVSIHGRREALYVEFTVPIQALATVGPDDIKAIPEETRARLATSAKPIFR